MAALIAFALAHTIAINEAPRYRQKARSIRNRGMETERALIYYTLTALGVPYIGVLLYWRTLSPVYIL